MKLNFHFKKIFCIYFIFLLASIIFFILTRFTPPTPLSLVFEMVLILILPGFLLLRIFQIKIQGDWLDQCVMALVCGFIFSLSLNFLAIIVGWASSSLVIIWQVLVGLLLIFSFILELTRQDVSFTPIRWNRFWSFDSFNYLIIFSVAFCALVAISQNGSFFGGSDGFHLTIIRKVIGNLPLTVTNLNFAKDATLLVYAFPVWHIFLGFMVKICHSDIFSVWRDSAFALSFITMFVWFWLSRKIFNNKTMALVAFFSFILLAFYWDQGYLFTTIAVPHTLSQLLLLPLIVGLVLDYLFLQPNWKLFIIIILFNLVGALVHLTQYAYFLTILVSLGLFYGILAWKQPNYQIILKRILLLLAANVLIILPFALLLELKSHAISSNFISYGQTAAVQALKFSSLRKFDSSSIYAYLALPMVLFFFRRYQKIIIIPAMLLIAPIIYFTFLHTLAFRFLGEVYVDRLYPTLDWSFLVWALVVGFVFLLIDRLVTSMQLQGKLWKIGCMVVAVGAIITIVLTQLSTDWTSDFTKSIFRGNLFDFVLANLTWLIWVTVALAIIILILLYFRPKTQDFFKLDEIKNPWVVSCLLFSITFILFLAPYNDLFIRDLGHRQVLQSWVESSASFAKDKANMYTKSIGGAQILNYINTQVPAKSTFDTNTAFVNLGIMTDQHLTIYNDSPSTSNGALYDEKTSDVSRINILYKGDIDYILLKSSSGSKTFFDNNTRFFTKLFTDKGSILYRVDKVEIKKFYLTGK